MKGAQPHVCVVGSTNVDLFFRTERLPRPGETLAGKSFHLGYGGKGANQAVMAARLGARVSMVGRVGRDVFGEEALRNFHREQVETAHVQVDAERPTGVASIVVDDAAENCILIVPGANHGLTPAHVQDAAAVIRAADVVLCQLEVPVECCLEAFRLARAAGVRTILNPAPAAALPDELLRLTDLCVPNETEIEALTGAPVAPEGMEAAARALRRRGPRMVIVTLGARGALVVDDDTRNVPAFAVRAVDPTGAGDAFIGSLAVFLAEGVQLTEAVRRANAAAALSVTRLGTQTAYPRRGEVEALLGAGT
jgi:ribokinase